MRCFRETWLILRRRSNPATTSTLGLRRTPRGALRDHCAIHILQHGADAVTLVLTPTRCLAFAALMRDDVLGCAPKDTRKANYRSFLLQPFFSLPRPICWCRADGGRGPYPRGATQKNLGAPLSVQSPRRRMSVRPVSAEKR